MIHPPKVKRPLAQSRLKIELTKTPLDHKQGDFDRVHFTLDNVGMTDNVRAYTSYEKALKLLEDKHSINPLNEEFNKVDYRDGKIVFNGAIVNDRVCFVGITSTRYSFEKDSTHGYFVHFDVYCDNRNVYSNSWSYKNCGREIDLTIKTFEEINEFIFE